jgi:hypothetical protein
MVVDLLQPDQHSQSHLIGIQASWIACMDSAGRKLREREHFEHEIRPLLIKLADSDSNEEVRQSARGVVDNTERRMLLQE